MGDLGDVSEPPKKLSSALDKLRLGETMAAKKRAITLINQTITTDFHIPQPLTVYTAFSHHHFICCHYSHVRAEFCATPCGYKEKSLTRPCPHGACGPGSSRNPLITVLQWTGAETILQFWGYKVGRRQAAMV